MLRSAVRWTCEPRRSQGVSEYRVEPLPDGRFAVLSTLGEHTFAGTLGECSDWLDARETECRLADDLEQADKPASPAHTREG
jgi:hypothetical protein